MGIYKLPLGIRIPRYDEYPKGYVVEEVNKKRDSANIVQGYKLVEVSDKKFTHFTEINIDIDKLWSLFISLSDSIIGDKAYGLIGFKGEKPTLSKISDKKNIIELFSKYQFELSNDGFSEFGIAYYDDNTLNEIYITTFKYVQVWTTDKDSLVKALRKAGLKEKKILNFIDEFPVVSEAISPDEVEGILSYTQILSEIKEEFEKF
ncbi:hypothetical protein [Clostridium paridis]|uniref:Uncharacterized protein n=1 Tax=Clostridium paridis TaxID=2803863 RepID=A0A937FH74_9CLOT|nr:hypothetical protein [Clostridium paridis]MBL4931912.1 hypothetical protein [Clostridium paridis]